MGIATLADPNEFPCLVFFQIFVFELKSIMLNNEISFSCNKFLRVICSYLRKYFCNCDQTDKEKVLEKFFNICNLEKVVEWFG